MYWKNKIAHKYTLESRIKVYMKSHRKVYINVYVYRIHIGTA